MNMNACFENDDKYLFKCSFRQKDFFHCSCCSNESDNCDGFYFWNVFQIEDDLLECNNAFFECNINKKNVDETYCVSKCEEKNISQASYFDTNDIWSKKSLTGFDTYPIFSSMTDFIFFLLVYLLILEIVLFFAFKKIIFCSYEDQQKNEKKKFIQNSDEYKLLLDE